MSHHPRIGAQSSSRRNASHARRASLSDSRLCCVSATRPSTHCASLIAPFFRLASVLNRRFSGRSNRQALGSEILRPPLKPCSLNVRVAVSGAIVFQAGFKRGPGGFHVAPTRAKVWNILSQQRAPPPGSHSQSMPSWFTSDGHAFLVPGSHRDTFRSRFDCSLQSIKLFPICKVNLAASDIALSPTSV